MLHTVIPAFDSALFGILYLMQITFLTSQHICQTNIMKPSLGSRNLLLISSRQAFSFSFQEGLASTSMVDKGKRLADEPVGGNNPKPSKHPRLPR